MRISLIKSYISTGIEGEFNSGILGFSLINITILSLT